MPITCRECGTTNTEGTRFCTTCGAYLEWTGERRPSATPDRQPAEAEERVKLEQRAGVEVELADPRLVVAPGHSATSDVLVHNSGTQVDEVRLSVRGPLAPWATLEPAVVNLYPDHEGHALLTLSPPMAQGVLAGETRFEVVAESSHAAVSSVAGGVAVVSAEHGVDAVLEPRISRGNGRAVQRVRLTNTGNAPATVELSGADHEGAMQVDVLPSSVVVPPFSTASAEVVTRVPWRLVGPDQLRPFDVVAAPERPLPRATLPGQRTSTAVFRSWWPVVLLCLVALLVVALAVLLPQADRIRGLFGGGGEQQQQNQQAGTVEVPDVTGRTAQEAQGELQQRGLVPEFPPQTLADAVVIGTDPPAGEVVPVGSTVQVAVEEQQQEPPPEEGQPTPEGP